MAKERTVAVLALLWATACVETAAPESTHRPGRSCQSTPSECENRPPKADGEAPGPDGGSPDDRQPCRAVDAQADCGSRTSSRDADVVGPEGGDANDGALRGAPNAIVAENALPGTAAWAMTQPSPNHEIEGYADTTSAAPGDVVRVFVSSSAASTFRWKLFRIGYYGGLGGRLIDEGAPMAVATQAPCPVDPGTGLIECKWSPSFELMIRTKWVTGQYMFKLIREDGFESYVPLVVREAFPQAPILYQASVTTWQAYNPWGGASLYKNQLPDSVGFTAGHAYQVSFDRPYEYSRLNDLQAKTGAGEHFYSERHLLEWLEREGYDVGYATNIDIDTNPGLLSGRKLFTSVGHDEYWSLGERHALEKARDEGVSLGFFSANTGYWRIRLEPSTSGAPRRIVTCYKSRGLDPVGDAADTTVRYREQPYPQPENALIGQMYELFTVMDGFPLIAGNAKHWIYEGTGISDGDTLSNVVGFEWDHVFFDENMPPGLEILATSPALGAAGAASVANVTVYYPTSSSFVFSGGSIQWSWGLGKRGYEDSRIQKMTENVIARAGLTPYTPTVVERRPPPSDIGVAGKVTVFAGTGEPGHVDGDAVAAQFNNPVGVAFDQAGNLFVTEARNHDVRKIAVDGTVSTVAGCGPDDETGSGKYANGNGVKACFDTPSGIAVGLDGSIFVSDTRNNRIRLIDPDGNVGTYAGSGTAGPLDSSNRKVAQFRFPRGLAIGPDGALYVADGGNSAIRRIDDNGVTTVAQDSSEVSGVAVSNDGTVYAIVSGASQVSVAMAGALVPIANETGTPGDQPGMGSSALLRPSDGMIVDGSSLIVTDMANEKLRRIALTPEHTVTTLVGTGSAGTAVGLGATATLRMPRGVAMFHGDYYIADSDNHRILRVER